MFIWFVYPLIWNASIPASIVNVLVLPVLITLFMIDENLFIDQEATQATGGQIDVPREGLPTSFAKAYNIHSLLWGNFAYLEDPEVLEFDLTQMILWYTMSAVQLVLSFLLEPILIAWGFTSAFSIATIIFYEVYILELSFYDGDLQSELNEARPY